MRRIVSPRQRRTGTLPRRSGRWGLRYPSPVPTPGRSHVDASHVGGSMAGWIAQEGGPIKAVFGSFENNALWVILIISLIALLFAWYLVREVLRAPEGTDKMKEIAKAIQEGASAYLSRQFRTVGIFLVVLAIAIFFVLPVPKDAAHS